MGIALDALIVRSGGCDLVGVMGGYELLSQSRLSEAA